MISSATPPARWNRHAAETFASLSTEDRAEVRRVAQSLQASHTKTAAWSIALTRAMKEKSS